MSQQRIFFSFYRKVAKRVSTFWKVYSIFFHFNFEAVFSLNWWQELILVVFQWISSISYGFDKFILNMTVFFLFFLQWKRKYYSSSKTLQDILFLFLPILFFQTISCIITESFIFQAFKEEVMWLPTYFITARSATHDQHVTKR